MALTITDEVNHATKELVDNSPLLQYKIELATLGMQDVRSADVDVATSRSRLSSAERAWSQFRPTSQSQVLDKLDGCSLVSKTFGDILAQFLPGMTGGRTVILHDLVPDGTFDKPQRWEISVEFPFHDVFVHAEDDLLVLVEHQ